MADTETAVQNPTDAAGGVQPVTEHGLATTAPVSAGDTAASVETQGQEGAKTESAAPEQYADFAAPEGGRIDAALVSEFVPLAKELGLSQDAAQKVVDLYASKVMPHIEQVFAEQHAQRVEEWGKATRDDKEIGGQSFNANVQTAQKAIARFGTPELKELLDTTGLGNNPEFVRFCMRVGNQISEDTLVVGGTAGGKRSVEEIMYGSNN